MTRHELICADNEIRIDKYLSQTELGLSRSAAASLIEAENVLVNGKAVNKKHKLMQGDIITVSVPDPVEYEAKAENIPLDIVYEDSCLLVEASCDLFQYSYAHLHSFFEPLPGQYERNSGHFDPVYLALNRPMVLPETGQRT